MDILDKMVWADMETTGLDADAEIPLEIGVYVTDQEGMVLGAIQRIVLHPDVIGKLDHAVPIVKEMHDKNHLRADIEYIIAEAKDDPSLNLDGQSIEAVEAEILLWLENEMGLKSGIYPMTGSTINFDRSFLFKYFPKLHNWFHYRNNDISTLKNLCAMLNPAVYDQKASGMAVHRVAEDIAASIAEYQFYLDNFLMVHLPQIFTPDNPLDTTDVTKLEAALADQPETAKQISDFLADPSTGVALKRPTR